MIRILALFCVLIFSSSGWGQDKSDSSFGDALKNVNKKDRETYSRKYLDQTINQPKTNLCDTKKTEASKAMREFAQLCKKAGLSSTMQLTSQENTYPGPNCLGQIMNCRDCQDPAKANDEKCLPPGLKLSDLDDDEDDDDEDGRRSVLVDLQEIAQSLAKGKQAQQSTSEAQEAKRAAKDLRRNTLEAVKYCAPHAARKQPELEKKQKDLAKDRRDLKEEARKAHERVLDLAKDMEDQERDLDNELARLEEERTEVLDAATQINESADEEQAKLTAKHSELATRIQEIYTQMEVVQLEQQDKELQQLAKCREAAMKSLENKWKILAERRGRSRDNAGSMVAALSKVGANDETRADREVLRLRNKCYNQEEARRTRELFTKGTQTRLDALNREIATSQRVMGEIRAAIQNIPTKKIKAMEKLNAKLQKLNEKINKAHQAKQAFIQRKFQRTQIATKASADAQDSADAVEAQYSETQKLLRDLRQISDKARMGEVDEKDFGALDELDGAASLALRALQEEERTCALLGEDKVSPSTKEQIKSLKGATGVK